MVIRSNYNRKKTWFRGRKIDGFSVTIPHQAMSVKEIYERYNQGVPLDLNEQRALFDNLTLDDFDVMDMTEVQSVADLYNRMSDIQKRAHLEKWLNPDVQKETVQTEQPTHLPKSELDADVE